MISAPIPSDEALRLERLQSYRVLDTVPEQRFDSIARLAAYICQTPVALVSLVDTDRQWFKANIGLPITESTRQIAFCAHTITQKQLMIVPDALADDRFYDNPFVTGSPNIRFYAGSPLLTHDGHAMGTLCVIDDHPRTLSDEQKEALEALSQQVIAQMEMNLRVHELEASKAELMQANRALENFTLMVAHDLQEPLRKVQTFGDRLQGRARHILPPALMDYVDRMVGATARMHTLVHNLLTFSRLKQSEIRRERVDLNNLIEETIDDLEDRLRESGGDVEVGTLPEIWANPIQMRQLFQNLIANALKFQRLGVKPVVTICAAALYEKGEEWMQIVIRDNGIGFDPSEAENIFDPFYRLESRLRFEGSGLGLAICREIVTHHGGTIVAEAERGVGATFTIKLPLGKERPI